MREHTANTSTAKITNMLTVCAYKAKLVHTMSHKPQAHTSEGTVTLDQPRWNDQR